MGQETASHALWAAMRVCEDGDDTFIAREVAVEMEADVSSKQVGQWLRKLQENGLVEKWGSAASQRWELTV